MTGEGLPTEAGGFGPRELDDAVLVDFLQKEVVS
jgi:hypothetical protein